MTDHTDPAQKLSPEIVVSGHMCVDLLPQLEDIDSLTKLLPGHLFEVGPMTVTTGGCASNTALALYRLGVPVTLMAPVGDDLMGQAILGYLRGVDPSLTAALKIMPGQTGSYTIVLNPAHADRTFIHGAGTNALYGPDSIDFEHVADAKIFHMGYPPLLPRLMVNEGLLLQEIYRRAKEANVVTSMDMVMSNPDGANAHADWRTILRNALPYVDIFLPSIEEMLLYLRRKDYDAWKNDIHAHLTLRYLDDFTSELLDMGSVIAGFKLGHYGIYMRTADASRLSRLARLPLDISSWSNVKLWMPAFQVEVAGATGAGDSAYAGFLGALLRGWTPERALRWACAVGACNVEVADSNSGVRSWQETQRRIDAGWPIRLERLV